MTLSYVTTTSCTEFLMAMKLRRASSVSFWREWPAMRHGTVRKRCSTVGSQGKRALNRDTGMDTYFAWCPPDKKDDNVLFVSHMVKKRWGSVYHKTPHIICPFGSVYLKTPHVIFSFETDKDEENSRSSSQVGWIILTLLGKTFEIHIPVIGPICRNAFKYTFSMATFLYYSS